TGCRQWSWGFRVVREVSLAGCVHQKLLENVRPIVRGGVVTVYGCAPHSTTEFGSASLSGSQGLNSEHSVKRDNTARSSNTFFTKSSAPQVSFFTPQARSKRSNEGCLPSRLRSSVRRSDHADPEYTHASCRCESKPPIAKL